MFALATTFVLAAMAILQVHGQATIPANCDRTVSVAAGDNCASISAQDNVSTYQLAAVNPWLNADCSNLVAGETICIGIAGQDCQDTYVVGTNESCAEIASRFGISTNTLLANNPNLNAICTDLFPTEVLCVSSTIYVN